MLTCVADRLGRIELETFARTCHAAWAAVRAARAESSQPVCCDLVRLCDLAAECGHLDLLQWLHAQGCPVARSSRTAARAGQLHVLEWIAEAGVLPVIGPGDLMVEAATQGHVHVLEWLISGAHSQGIERRARGSAMTRKLGSSALDVIPAADSLKAFRKAASNGHLHVLRWGDSRNRIKASFWMILKSDAVSRGDWHVVHWVDTARPTCQKHWPGPLCYVVVLATAMAYTALIHIALDCAERCAL